MVIRGEESIEAIERDASFTDRLHQGLLSQSLGLCAALSRDGKHVLHITVLEGKTREACVLITKHIEITSLKVILRDLTHERGASTAVTQGNKLSRRDGGVPVLAHHLRGDVVCRECTRLRSHHSLVGSLEISLRTVPQPVVHDVLEDAGVNRARTRILLCTNLLVALDQFVAQPRCQPLVRDPLLGSRRHSLSSVAGLRVEIHTPVARHPGIERHGIERRYVTKAKELLDEPSLPRRDTRETWDLLIEDLAHLLLVYVAACARLSVDAPVDALDKLRQCLEVHRLEREVHTLLA